MTMATNSKQTINFDGAEDNHFFEITSDDVEIISSAGDHELGCSKVTLKNVVDFTWEHKLYSGQVLAVHMLGKYIAYGIKVKNVGMVRVTSKDSNSRGLVKGLVGPPQDLAFAHIEEEMVLASVDEEGNLFVHTVELPEVMCNLKLFIPFKSYGPMIHRVIWCPYIPDSEFDEDAAKLLVVTRGCEATMISVNTVFENYGPEPSLENGISALDGVLELVDEHSRPITDAMFAPDGTALATTSSSGEVKFFQVYMYEEKKTNPRCLHQWTPHDGRPVSSIFFLDNHKIRNPTVQYWKFAITGCNNNSEFKLWSCETWACLQTIIIKPNPNMNLVNGNLTLKAMMDRSSQYLILSDIYNNIMYIMQIIKNDDETQVFIKSVSEFLLPCSILSFEIVDTALLKDNNITSTHIFELEDTPANFDDEIDVLLSSSPVTNSTLTQFTKSNKGVFVKMFIVQVKGIQECRIIYHPQINYNTTVLNITDTESFTFNNDLADLSSAASNQHVDTNHSNSDINETSLKDFNNSSIQQSTPLQNILSHAITSHINLMTPDAFNNIKKDVTPQNKNISCQDDNMSDNSLKAFDGSVLEARVSESPTIMNQQFLDDLMYIGTNRLEDIQVPNGNSEACDKKSRDNLASGGSSPSREVQEILSLKDSRSDLLDFDIIVDGESEAHDSTTETINTVISIPVNTDVNKEEKSWPCPPLIEPIQVTETNCNTSSNSFCSSNVFTTYTNAKTQSSEDYTNNQNILVEMLLQQSKQILNLESELKKIRENECMVQNRFAETDQLIHNVEANLKKTLDEISINIQRQLSSFEDSLISKMSPVIVKDINNTVPNTVVKMMDQLVVNKFSSSITIEIQRCVVPSVVTSLDNLKQAIQLDLSKRFSATEHILEEQIQKICYNKHIIDLIANSLITASRTALTNTMKTQMESSLIPSFERATNEMFKQIHDVFFQGTKDYATNFEQTLEKHKRQMDKSKDIIYRMDQLSENLKMQTDATNTINKHIHESVTKAVKVMQENLSKNINEHINVVFLKQTEELENHLRQAIRSNAVTPALQNVDSSTYRTQINEYLRLQDISGAFQHALMASDLNLVVYVCEKVDPTTLFKQTPCPLPQNVLLSLIQQLSADLLNHSDLKHRYLEEALMNLDTNNPGTKEHIPSILKALKKQLSNFVTQHPNNTTAKRIRMLSMVTDSLLSTVSFNNVTPNKTPLGL